MKYVILIVCTFFVAGCKIYETETGREKAAPQRVLSLDMWSKGKEKFKFGQWTETVFRMKNISDKAIIILSIKPLTSGGGGISLCGSAYGQVSKLQTDDAYVYNRLRQMATLMGFFEGVLLPEQEVLVSTSYRPLSKAEEFAVTYYVANETYDGSA